MRILFTGGGTGGHFYPIVAVYRKIKDIAEEERLVTARLYYAGPDDFGHDILRKDAIDIRTFSSGKWRRYASFQNVLDVLKMIVGVAKALPVMFQIMPDVVFSKGGYGSIPTVISAIVYRIPLIIHESDSRPGLVNRLAGRFADRIALSFESTRQFFPSQKKDRIALTGVPIRDSILGGSRDAAEEEFSVFTKRPVVLILGGSQGSGAINAVVLEILRELVGDTEVIHQTGKEAFSDISGQGRVILTKEELPYYHPYAFFDDRMLRHAYAIADIIVSRAGATSIFEIAAAAKPSILIPLKNSAQEHQKINAYEYAETGAANVIEEENLSPNVLLNEIRKLAADTARRALMSERARHFAKPDAAELIAREILKLGLHEERAPR